MAKDPTEISKELLEAAAGAVAIEAIWEGDTKGWFVCVNAVFQSDTGFRARSLKTFRFGSDMTLFNGEVPPWPKAAAASGLGAALAQRLGVPFHFPATNWPETDCPHWWESDLSMPCGGCGVRLLQNDDLPCRGWCYHCHTSREFVARESALTPQERASPRCWTCAKPMVGAASDEIRCPPCWTQYREQYDDVTCTDCGRVFPLMRESSDVPTCKRCLVGRLMSRSTAAQRRKMAESTVDIEDPFGRTRRLSELVGCSAGQSVGLWGVIYSERDRSA